MIKRQYRDAIYMKHQFEPELIVPCVRWYITYRLSYRDQVAESGSAQGHTRWPCIEP